MIETEMMMKQAGWLDKLHNTDISLTTSPIIPVVYKTGIQWKNIVKQCRENVLKDKKINYATTASTFTQLKNTLFQPLLSNYYLQNTFSTTSNHKKLKILISLITLFKNFPLTKNKNELFVL